MRRKRRLTQECAAKVLVRLRELTGCPTLGAAQCINRLRKNKYPSADLWPPSTINRWVAREGGVNEDFLIEFMGGIKLDLNLETDLEDVPRDEFEPPSAERSHSEARESQPSERRTFSKRRHLPFMIAAITLVLGFVGILVGKMNRPPDEWIEERQRNLKTSLTIVTKGGWKISTLASGFPTSGSPSGSPMGLAITDSGNLLVSQVNGNVLTFRADTDGQLVDKAPVAYSYGGWNAMGMARYGNHFYLAQLAAGCVVEMNESGVFLRQIAGNLYGNLAIAVNPANGHLYASSEYNNWIAEIDPVTLAKKVFVTLPRGESGAGSLATDGVTLYVQTFEDLDGPWGSGHIVGYRMSDGEKVFDSGYLTGARGIAIGSGKLAGNIFVNCFIGQLVQINVKSNEQTVIANGGLGGGYPTVPTPDGCLLFCQGDRVLRLSPPAGDSFQSLSRISLDSNLVPGGATATGTVFLDSPASTRLAIALSTSNGTALVSDHAQIPAGAMSAVFPVKTKAVSKSRTCALTGTLNGASARVTLKTRPPVVQSVSLSQHTIAAGEGVTARVTLDVPAPPDGVVVTFLSGDTTAVPTPAHVRVPAGERVAVAQIQTIKIERSSSVVVTASAGGCFQSERLLVEGRNSGRQSTVSKG